MRNIVLILLQLFIVLNIVQADTPPPGKVTVVQPTGSNLHTDVDNFPSTYPVTGTFWQATQPVSGTFFQATQPVSGNLGRTWSLLNSTDSVNVGNFPSTYAITASSLPLPTGAATSALQTTINSTLGSPFQAGGSIGNSSFGISGTLPSFTSTPTFNLGTLNGAATASAQTTGNASLSSIDSKLTSPLAVTGTFFQATQPVSGTVTATQGTGSNLHVAVDSAPTTAVTGTFFQATQPVSASALPLPTGAATSALQTTGNTNLSTINTTLGSPFQAGGSIGNTSFTATQATGTNLHTVVDSAPTTAITASSLPLPTGASTSALQTTGNTSLATLVTNSPVLGQSTMSASVPVAIASDQSSVKVLPQSLTSATTTLTGTGTAIVNTTGMGSVFAQITGSWAGTIDFEATIDGSTWQGISAVEIVLLNNQAPVSTTVNGNFAFNVAGFLQFRLRAVGPVTGSATVGVSASPNGSVINGILANVFTAQSGVWSMRLQDGSGSAVNKGQAAAASSLPVALANEDVQDLFFTGQSAQTATVNNIIPASSGATATDATGYRSGSIQVTSTGTGGTFIFEGSNDNTNFQTIPVWNQLILTGTPITVAIGATSSQLVYTFPIPTRYIRLRIASTITGGSIQAFTKLSQAAFAPGILQVAQATAANLATTATIASGTVTTVTTLANGQTAHSAASTGSPVRGAGRVNTAVDTTLVAGDVSDFFMTTGGQLTTKPFAMPEVDWQASSGTTPLATTSSTALKAAGAAGVRNYVTGCQFYNTAAAVSTTVSVLDGASVIWTGYLPATTAALPIVPNEVIFQTPLRGTAATAMNVQLGTVSASVYYNCQGYQAP